VYLETNDKKEPYHVKKMREFKGYDTILIEGFENIDRAEKLVGKTIWAEDVDVPLDEDVFHVRNVIGMRIIQSGEDKGVVRDVITYPQGDYLDVRRPDGTHAKIPFSDVFVLDVDESNGTIEVTDMEGLI
jgi:16S rRNA processing protein RimM